MYFDLYLQKMTIHYFAINKILKADYLRGRAKKYYANFISAKNRKSNFLYFTSLSVIRLTSPLKFMGEYMEPRGKAPGNYLIKTIRVKRYHSVN